MLTVGLTGGIGAGKSAVGAELAALGAAVIDADALARDAVAPGTSGLAAVVAEFGAEVLTPRGDLDRARLGEIVFADEARLARLNAIVHPRVAERSAEALEQAGAAGARVVVYEVPLLVENGLAPNYDVVVAVDADDEVRVARVGAARGMPAEQVRARMRAQAGREARLAAADFVIDNSGTPAQLRERVRELWARLGERAAAR